MDCNEILENLWPDPAILETRSREQVLEQDTFLSTQAAFAFGQEFPPMRWAVE